MELIVINENKLKIIMNAPDMDELGINENDFYLSTFNAREMLAKILKRAVTNTEFDHLSSEDKILLQLYPDTKGGCELFVTRIAFEYEEEIFMPEDDKRFLLPAPSKKSSERKQFPITYGFEKLEFAIDASKELIKLNFKCQSSFHRLNDGKYLLFIAQSNSDSRAINLLGEFGELKNTENSYLRSLERGSCIISKNAVEELSSL